MAMNRTVEFTIETEDSNENYVCLEFVVEIEFNIVKGSRSFNAPSDLDFYGYSEIDNAKIESVTATNENGDEVSIPDNYKNKSVSDIWSDDELLESVGDVLDFEQDEREAAAEAHFEAIRNGDFD